MEHVIKGRVGHGKALGRTLGFPTANVMSGFAYSEALAGVWAGWAEATGKKWPCIVNVGRHPTFPEGPATVEAHLIGFEGDLYGEEITLRLTAFLRGQLRFASGEALAEQLRRDTENALAILNKEESDVRTL